MFGPLHETFKMEGVSTDCSTRCSGIALDDLSVADRTKVVLLLVLLFDDHISSGNFNLDVLQKIRYFVLVYATIGDDIPQFFVIVGKPEE